MRIVFRTDASLAIGHGHVYRCLTLASVLRKHGAEIGFICRSLQGNLCELVERHGHQLMQLPAPGGAMNSVVHRDWLGCSWEEDARETTAAIADFGPVDWLVIDHYALDAEWERGFRHQVGRVLVIDDLADRHHECDVLLDQNIVGEMLSRYDRLLSPMCRRLIGPRFCLLQEAYSEARSGVSPRSGEIKRVLVFFGGADQRNLTGMALNALRSVGRSDLSIDVVLAHDSPHAISVERQTRALGAQLYTRVPSLADLVAQADLGIGAGGTTTWERICLGLPSLVITIAKNQEAIAKALHERELIRLLGTQDEVHQEDLSAVLAELFSNGLSSAWSERCLRTVDGLGAGRVAAALALDSESSLLLRAAEAGDEELLLAWANDPGTRESSFSPEQIDAESHHNWFHSRLRSKDSCRIYIAESDGLEVGQVRFERSGEHWSVDYAVSPGCRGLGLGAKMLGGACEQLKAEFKDCVLQAEVKHDNWASRRVFEKLQFQVLPARDGVHAFRCSK